MNERYHGLGPVGVAFRIGGRGVIELGPFRLEAPVGRGGMGQVWSGVHARFGYPVAVKFLTARSVQKPGFLAAFRNEVRLVAALDHPNVVRVYDYGEADERTATATVGRIPIGTPWLAMELVGGGTLSALGGRLDWSQLAPMIRALLDGLGHAHARGVVHRDLKPGNVLVELVEGATPPVLKLTDFGLASAVEAQDTFDAGPFAGGTPAYMAPEQFESRWRDYGPWTDLYGVGCLIWSMVRGLPPFGTTTTVEEKRRQHLTEPPPPLEPPTAVPEGFEPWLRTLLEKDPARRFRRCADALAAFATLGPPVGRSGKPSAPPPPSQVPTLVFDPDFPPTEPVGEERSGGPPLAIAAGETQVPPVPADWRVGDASGLPPQSDTPPVGLGLFGLRATPMVDRTDERDALWRALRRMDREGTTRAVVLAGPSGCGKSRLAEWFCQRAHETGAAQVLKATHSAVPGPTHGLGPMLRSTLRCQGLSREAVHARVEEIFSARGVGHADEWAALTEVIEPAGPEAKAAIRFSSPTERYVTVRRLLQAMTQERPCVLWFDDAHYGLDALRFALYLLDYAARQRLPLLVVLTVTDEVLAQRTDEANLLAELLEHERCGRVPVGPLPTEHRSDLVRGVLGLDPDLARRVEDRTAGNPLFVVQLVGDWVQRGQLTAGARGFRLRADEPLPATVTDLWAQRVARTLTRRAPEEGHALELAAILGTEVDPSEWSAACRLSPGATPSDGLLRELLDQRLVHCGPDGPSEGWSFSHETLRQALVARAEAAGRAADWHRACAELLEGGGRRVGGAPGGGSWAERVGRHWVGAGKPERALPFLQEGAQQRVSTGDHAVAEELVGLREAALTGLAAGLADPRWADGWLLRYELATKRGDWEDVDRWLARAEQQATAHGWGEVRGWARCFRGRQERVRGHHTRALSVLVDVEQDAAVRGDRRLVATSRLEIGECLLGSGDLANARHWVELALQEHEALADAPGAAEATMVLGECANELGEHAEAARLLRRAQAAFEQIGHRWKTADALNSQGDVARAQGDLDQAVALYRKARGLLKAIGSRSWIFPEYNTGLVHLARDDFDRARPVFEVAMATFIDQGNRNALANAHLALACCAAAAQAWLLFDEHLREARDLLLDTAYSDEDTARLATRAGALAADEEQATRARDARQLAVTLWTTLGRRAEVEALVRRT